MKKILQYPLVGGVKEQLVKVPLGSRILSIQSRFGEPNMWVLTDGDEKKSSDILVKIFATGLPISDENILGFTYIATYQVEAFGTVFHVFVKDAFDEGKVPHEKDKQVQVQKQPDETGKDKQAGTSKG